MWDVSHNSAPENIKRVFPRISGVLTHILPEIYLSKKDKE